MDNVNIVQLNCNNSRMVTQELIRHLNEHNINIALIQEPYAIRDDVNFKIPLTSGYRTIFRPSIKPKAAIIVDNLCSNVTFFPQLSTDHLTLISLEFGKKQIFLLSAYIPPNSDLHVVLPNFHNILRFTQNKTLIIGGDFNCRSELWFDKRNSARSNLLEEFILQNNLDIANQPGNPPTFNSTNGQSFIDLTLSSNMDPFCLTNWETKENITSSDHNLIQMRIGIPKSISSSMDRNYKLDLSSIKIEELEPKMAQLVQEMEEVLSNLKTPEDIEQATYQLHGKLDIILTKLGKKRKIYQNRPEWWTDEVERFRKIYLSKKSLFYKNKFQEYTQHLHSEMTNAKTKFKEKLDKARKKSWNKFAEEDLKKNPWGVIYKIAAEKFHKTGVLNAFTNNNAITSNATESLNFLMHSLLPDDNSTLNDVHQNALQLDYDAITPDVNDWEEIPEEMVETFISNLNNNKAPGFDKIKGKIAKQVHPWVGPILAKIYSACWNLAYFPKIWKKGNLVVLLKDPQKDNSLVKNYRPITLLPTYSKIFEKIIRLRLDESLDPLHSNRQFGFCKGKSAVDALEALTTQIKRTKAKYMATIFFDIQGAFDNVWWPGLIQTMRERQIPHRIIATIKSYLTNRVVQFTQGSVTVEKECTKGCPQGSVLGPTLWNFIMDSLLDSEWPLHTKAFAYADDLAVTVESNWRSELKQKCQIVIEKIDNWAKNLKMSVSETKTTCMVNKSPSRLHHRDMNLRINGTRIKIVKTQNYLGVLLDPKLNFQTNAAHAAKRVRKITMGLRKKALKTWNMSSADSLRTIYNGAILPVVTYGSRIWCEKLHTSKVKRQYLSAYGTFARLLTNSYTSVSMEAAGVLAGLVPLDIEIQKLNCIRELRRVRGSYFLDEYIGPVTFDTIRHAKEYLQLRAEDVWQTRWDSSEKGRTTYSFVPSVLTVPERGSVTTSWARTQILTGHGEFATHLKRIGKIEDAECFICNDQLDDPLHRIRSCPAFVEAQGLIRQELGVWPPSLLDIPFLENDEIFEQLTSKSMIEDELEHLSAVQ